MFTGIVRAVGEIVALRPMGEGVRLEIDGGALSHALEPGDSVAVAGVCLTVTDRAENRFSVDAVGATLARTTIGGWDVGQRVNLEPALRAGDPLGGHLVQGHVDAVGEVASVIRQEGGGMLDVRLPSGVVEVTVSQGSLTIDGVSLTVNRLESPVARFAIIPYTWSHTTLGGVRSGGEVNVEADVIGTYVARMIRPYSRPQDG